MIKAIRILEVPIYLLVIALGCIENGSTAMGIFIAIISIVRLFTNHITDEFIYKSKGN
tara:strand:- start:243 stop:416 length:174 start_codon:yes stop_codon:yes gene_type:complete